MNSYQQYVDRVLYVGMSKNLKNRWYIHERLKDAILAGATKISYLPVATEVEARHKEKQLIRHFKPILNNEKLIDKRTHSDYTQSAAYLPKDLVKNFKQLTVELELGHSEARVHPTFYSSSKGK